MSTIWSQLGIAPTREIPAIRRAYAEKLRAIDQDRDTASFMALRTAFTTALRLAGQPAATGSPPAFVSPPPPPKFADLLADNARIAAETKNFETAEAAGDPVAAYAAYTHLRALGAGGGSGAVSPLTIRLAATAAAAAAISTADVERLLREIGLDAMALDRAKNLPGLRALTDDLNARNAAETWLEAIQKRATASRWSKANRRDRYGYQAALFITGRRNYRGAAFAPTIQRELDRFDKHRRFIGKRLDATRLDAARPRKDGILYKFHQQRLRWAISLNQRNPRRLWWGLVFIGIMAGVLRAVFDPAPH